ncbi:hypothetical protein [Pseudooceanicola aestuarii]|uniref:hypothetical protein n=1 Tax=Pseudooceanicola aestuarii TaxID=2697319 RepID=UPI0013D0257F|nr:hypothetical protein [Pseudooceanicola aestuarii]
MPLTTETRFSAAFEALVPASATFLSCRGADLPRVLTDDTELAPALPLGDVLAEELALDVPYDCLVVLVPEGADDRFSRALGRAVGDCLLIAQDRGHLPMERETDALFMLAHSAARLACTARLRDLGVEARPFCLGLADSLDRFWCRGAAKGGSGALFARSDFLSQPQLTAYLRRLDPCFTAPEPRRIPIDLLTVSGSGLGVGDWIACLQAGLREALDPSVSPYALPATVRRPQWRFNLH